MCLDELHVYGRAATGQCLPIWKWPAAAETFVTSNM